MNKNTNLCVPAFVETVDANLVLGSLPYPVLVVDHLNRLIFVNDAAENFLVTSAALMIGKDLINYVPEDSPLFMLIEQTRRERTTVGSCDFTLSINRQASRHVTVDLSLLSEMLGAVVIVFKERSVISAIKRQFVRRRASTLGMSAMLAHEVKNSLSGIRGAAQLLNRSLENEDRSLALLIVDEVDRICALIDSMDGLTISGPVRRNRVNIHEVLSHVRLLAVNGFANDIVFHEVYDPSLPPLEANRDQLIQVFLNLVKNAAEAASPTGGEIVLSTAFQHGLKLVVPGTDKKQHLPLVVSVQDNGPGIPEELWAKLFDPFVTTKLAGKGIGLSLVDTIVHEHGGVVEFDSQPGRTCFRVHLPIGDGQDG